jgi:phage-related protein
MKPPKILRVIYYWSKPGARPARDWLRHEIDEKPSYLLRQLLKRLEEHGPNVIQLYPKFFEHLEKGLFQVRLEHGKKWYRLLFFYDSNKAVVCHGFEKETNETPRNEINTALERKKIYEERMKKTPKAKKGRV